MTDTMYTKFPVQNGIIQSITYNGTIPAHPNHYAYAFIIITQLKKYNVCIPKFTIGILNETPL